MVNNNERKIIGVLFRSRVIPYLESIVSTVLMESSSLVDFYRHLLFAIFDSEHFSPSAKMFLASLTFSHLLELLIKRHLPTYSNAPPNRSQNGRKHSIKQIEFIYDPEGPRLLDRFHVSNRDKKILSAKLVKLLEEKASELEKTYKNIDYSAFTTELIKKIFRLKIKHILKVPAAILGLVMLVEKVRTAILYEFKIKHNNFSDAETTEEDRVIHWDDTLDLT